MSSVQVKVFYKFRCQFSPASTPCITDVETEVQIKKQLVQGHAVSYWQLSYKKEIQTSRV